MANASQVQASGGRGFTIDRDDGHAPLPGSLHTNRLLASWLSLPESDVVQVRTGKVELGQGILTALQLLAAEELGLPLAAIRIAAASTDTGPDEGVTSGSLSVQDSGAAVQHACAQLRGMARERAAAQSGVDIALLTQDDGGFSTPDGRRAGDYWSLLNERDLLVEYSPQYQPKQAHERQWLGRARVPRLDLHDKVFGRARFIQDLQLPDMLHGRVVRGVAGQARLVSWPPRLSPPLPAQVRVWADGNFVAVLAPLELQAERAAQQLRDTLQWTLDPILPAQATLQDFLRQAPRVSTVIEERGDAAQWPADGLRLQATYFKPYLAHASIGTSCAVALFDGRRLTVWSHSQSIHNLRDDLALAFGTGMPALHKDDIVVHHVEGSGCYGHNGADDVAFDAALLATTCPGQPVRVLWSRRDELSQSPFGPAHLVDLCARVDAQGQITHWSHEHWANGYSSRPGRAKVPALLGASQRANGQPLPLPINPPMGAGGGAERNAIAAYVLPHMRVTSHRVLHVPLRTSAMRALGAYANVFATESFMDELAHACGADPLAFRRRHLRDERALELLNTLVQRSRWWGQRAAEPENIGYGLAWARYKNKGAWCAVLARVQVEAQVRVLSLDLAVDVGMVVDLDGVINQIEGGAVQSVSWTLKEQVCFDAEGVRSHGWDSYPVLRFSEVPDVTVHVLDRPQEPPLGAGEAAQGPVAAALANAVYDALGVRVRSLPLNIDNITQAMHAASPTA